MFDSRIEQNDVPAWLSVSGGLESPLLFMLMAAEIVPGSALGYQLAKTIYAYHPLGAILTEAPIKRAQCKPREISVPVVGEAKIVEQWQTWWDTIGKIGATAILHNLSALSRVYGISSIACGEVGGDSAKPLDFRNLSRADLFFNVLDPLNTAGSLVMDQDPNKPDFLKPSNSVRVNSQLWHPSRLQVKMNESPLYIEWTSSAFGFVGRSVYQRALYPLKTFIQSMVTDQMVVQKSGLLVAKLKSPGSFIDNVMRAWGAVKRATIKQGVTGQVLQIGTEEEIASLNLLNLEGPFNSARTNVIRNIASAAGMPASIVAQETLTSGFGEGTEDAKKEAAYLDYIRQDMQPAYDFMDTIVMHKAWSPEFFETMKQYEPQYYGKMSYDEALFMWKRAFKATWPNLLEEPESEKAKTADVIFKTLVAAAEVLLPEMDPMNKANVIGWFADNINEREELFAGNLDIDVDVLRTYLEENKASTDQALKEPGAPAPFKATA